MIKTYGYKRPLSKILVTFAFTVLTIGFIVHTGNHQRDTTPNPSAPVAPTTMSSDNIGHESSLKLPYCPFLGCDEARLDAVALAAHQYLCGHNVTTASTSAAASNPTASHSSSLQLSSYTAKDAFRSSTSTNKFTCRFGCGDSFATETFRTNHEAFCSGTSAQSLSWQGASSTASSSSTASQSSSFTCPKCDAKESS